jgi:hypothetical protein
MALHCHFSLRLHPIRQREAESDIAVPHVFQSCKSVLPSDTHSRTLSYSHSGCGIFLHCMLVHVVSSIVIDCRGLLLLLFLCQQWKVFVLFEMNQDFFLTFLYPAVGNSDHFSFNRTFEMTVNYTQDPPTAQQAVNARSAKPVTVIKIINVALVSCVQISTRQSLKKWEWIHARLIVEMLDVGIGNSAMIPARYRNAMMIMIVMVLKPVIQSMVNVRGAYIQRTTCIICGIRPLESLVVFLSRSR